MHAPEIGEAGRIQPLTPGWRRPQRLGCLPHVVLKQPGLSQGAPDLHLLVAMESGLLQRADQEGGRLSPRPALERLDGAPINISPCHAGEYIRYTGGWIDGDRL